MNLEIEIIGKIGKGITKAKIESAVRSTLRESLKFKKNKKPLSVSLALVDESEIKKINRIYRSKNEVTDVLSFSYLNQGKIDRRNPLFLGELVVCAPYVLKSAKKNNVSYSRQLIYVITHGMLHLIGMRHSKKMYALQDQIASE
jgi:probable rRNA maturation factor